LFGGKVPASGVTCYEVSNALGMERLRRTELLPLAEAVALIVVEPMLQEDHVKLSTTVDCLGWLEMLCLDFYG
jgi:hypothetical protein